MSFNLVVVGAGELGCRVATEWRLFFPKASIFLKTRSEKPERTKHWKQLGYDVLSPEDNETKAPYVLFCTPPTGVYMQLYRGNPRCSTSTKLDIFTDDYDDLVEASLSHNWDESSDVKSFVLISSGGVYAEDEGGVVDEGSAVKDNSAYVSRILRAEQAVLARRDGFVLRLGGLYTLTRGAHNYWLTSGKAPFTSSPLGLINLIHYDDAADATITLLKEAKGQRPSSSLLLLSDGKPLTRRDICAAARKNPKFEHLSLPEFVGAPKTDGKMYDSSLARKVLHWEPRFSSFDEFMTAAYTGQRAVNLLDFVK